MNIVSQQWALCDIQQVSLLNARMNFGTRLKRARERAGLTQGQLAQRSGVKQQTISVLEKTDAARSKHAAALVKAIGGDLEEFLTGKARQAGTRRSSGFETMSASTEETITVSDEVAALLPQLEALRARSDQRAWRHVVGLVEILSGG